MSAPAVIDIHRGLQLPTPEQRAQWAALQEWAAFLMGQRPLPEEEDLHG